jgi:hypothetical protein
MRESRNTGGSDPSCFDVIIDRKGQAVERPPKLPFPEQFVRFVRLLQGEIRDHCDVAIDSFPAVVSLYAIETDPDERRRDNFSLPDHSGKGGQREICFVVVDRHTALVATQGITVWILVPQGFGIETTGSMAGAITQFVIPSAYHT